MARPSILALGQTFAGMRITGFPVQNHAHRNRMVTLECLVCSTKRAAWANAFTKGRAPCKVCVKNVPLDLTGVGSDLSAKTPLALMQGDRLRILWRNTVPAEELFKSYGTDLWMAVSNEVFERWHPGILEKAPRMSTEDIPKLPPEPGNAVETPAQLIPYLVGVSDAHGEAAEAFLAANFPHVDDPDDLLIYEGNQAGWTVGGKPFNYLYWSLKDGNHT